MKEAKNIGKWWDDEAPVVATSKKNVLRLYVQAGKLMVAQPDWEDDNGEAKQGKTVTLDLAALKGNEEARDMFMSVVDMIDGE